MTSPGEGPEATNHPLDIDLLGRALGELDAAAAAPLAAHVDTCLLCRVRLARISAGLGALGDDARTVLAPAAPAPARRSSAARRSTTGRRSAARSSAEGEGPRPSLPRALVDLLGGDHRPAPAAGQLWLAGAGERVLVWLGAVRDDHAVAYAVTLDVEAVDETALIIDSLPALGRPGAVVTSVVATVPAAALALYVGDLDVGFDVDRLRRALATGAVGHGLPVGEASAGASGGPIELRQLLADRLDALDPPADDGTDDVAVTDAASVVRDLFEQVAHDLPARRGRQCVVSPPSDARVQSFAVTCDWEVVAVVTELTCTIVVAVAERPVEAALGDPGAAMRLAELADATTVAMVGRAAPHPAALFEVPDLQHAIETPRGVEAGPRPHFAPLPVSDALFKYLERTALVSALQAGTAPPVPAVDLGEVISRHAHTAIESLRAMGAQKEKRVALRGLSPTDAEAVTDAIRAAADVEDLLERLEGLVEP